MASTKDWTSLCPLFIIYSYDILSRVCQLQFGNCLLNITIAEASRNLMLILTQLYITYSMVLKSPYPDKRKSRPLGH